VMVDSVLNSLTLIGRLKTQTGMFLSGAQHRLYQTFA
jgi:hypothetical protein